MLQPHFLAQIVAICRENGIHTAVDTAGHVPYEWFTQVNPDLFLYDIKAVNPKLHKELTGVDGLLIWDNLRRLLADGKNIHIRIPCIPGANWEELPQIAAKLNDLGATSLELLPYHNLSEGKTAMHSQRCKKFQIPSNDDMQMLKVLFPIS